QSTESAAARPTLRNTAAAAPPPPHRSQRSYPPPHPAPPEPRTRPPASAYAPEAPTGSPPATPEDAEQEFDGRAWSCFWLLAWYTDIPFGPLAQLVRAGVSYTLGYRFESCRAYHV